MHALAAAVQQTILEDESGAISAVRGQATPAMDTWDLSPIPWRHSRRDLSPEAEEGAKEEEEEEEARTAPPVRNRPQITWVGLSSVRALGGGGALPATREDAACEWSTQSGPLVTPRVAGGVGQLQLFTLLVSPRGEPVVGMRLDITLWRLQPFWPKEPRKPQEGWSFHHNAPDRLQHLRLTRALRDDGIFYRDAYELKIPTNRRTRPPRRTTPGCSRSAGRRVRVLKFEVPLYLTPVSIKINSFLELILLEQRH